MERRVNGRVDTWVTVAQAAQILECSTSTIRAYMKKGLLDYLPRSEKDCRPICLIRSKRE